MPRTRWKYYELLWEFPATDVWVSGNRAFRFPYRLGASSGVSGNRPLGYPWTSKVNPWTPRDYPWMSMDWLSAHIHSFYYEYPWINVLPAISMHGIPTFSKECWCKSMDYPWVSSKHTFSSFLVAWPIILGFWALADNYRWSPSGSRKKVKCSLFAPIWRLAKDGDEVHFIVELWVCSDWHSDKCDITRCHQQYGPIGSSRHPTLAFPFKARTIFDDN